MSEQANKFIRISEVMEMTGLARSTIYKYARAGSFPATVKISRRAAAWVEHEVNEWMAQRMKDRI